MDRVKMDEETSIELFSFADGTTNETIVFGEAARERRRRTSGRGVEVCCRECGSDLIHPVECEQTSEHTWLLTLRCPDCEMWCEVALGRNPMERYVAQLHDQKRALTLELERWSLACFREDVERLLSLVTEDKVLPFDF